MNRRDKCIPIYGRLTPTGAGSGGSGSGGGGIIPTGTKEINITENGESDHDVTDYATAHVTVNVPKPTAKKTVEITANGTTTEDVADFGSIDIAVNVAGQTTDQWKDVFENFIAGNDMPLDALTLSVPSVRQYALSYAKLPETITLEGTLSINQHCFEFSYGVKTVNINSAKDILSYAFYLVSSLDTINAEALKSIASYGIYGCRKLTTLNAPNVTELSNNAISNCGVIEELYFPNVSSLVGGAINSMDSLKKVTIGDANVVPNMLKYCPALQTLDVKTSSSIYIPITLSKALIIRDITAVPTMSNTVSELKNTLNVYVPDDLVGAFKDATNWSAFGDRIKPLSEYVES